MGPRSTTPGLQLSFSRFVNMSARGRHGPSHLSAIDIVHMRTYERRRLLTSRCSGTATHNHSNVASETVTVPTLSTQCSTSAMDIRTRTARALRSAHGSSEGGVLVAIVAGGLGSQPLSGVALRELEYDGYSIHIPRKRSRHFGPRERTDRLQLRGTYGASHYVPEGISSLFQRPPDWDWTLHIEGMNPPLKFHTTSSGCSPIAPS